MIDSSSKPPTILGPDGRPIAVKNTPVPVGMTLGWRWFVSLAASVAIVATFLANMTSIFSRLLPTRDLSTAVREAAKTATTGPDEARIEGISALGTLWQQADDRELLVLADTLTAILLSESDHVRQAAEEAIGRAYDSNTWFWRRHKLRRLLYGSTGDWYPGAVIKLNWELQADPVRFSRQLVSTRQAVRKNWEDLRDTHMRKASLIGAALYESRLEGAYLRDADLRCADLRAADLSGAEVTGVNWRFANVQDMEPEALRRQALQAGALAFKKDEWRPPPDCAGIE